MEDLAQGRFSVTRSVSAKKNQLATTSNVLTVKLNTTREKGGKSFSQASGWPACDALNWCRFEAPRRAIHQIVESLSQLLDCFCRHQIKFEHGEATRVATVRCLSLFEDSSNFLIALQSWAHKAYYRRPLINLFRMRMYTEQTPDFATLARTNFL